MPKIFLIACLSFCLHLFVGLAASDLTIPVKDIQTFFTLPGINCDIQEELLTTPKGVRFVFVRHGEATSNVEKIYAGKTVDADLTAKGIHQAKKMGQQLKRIRFEEVYSSPCRRTFKTAQHLTKCDPLVIVVDERIVERSLGISEGIGEEEWNQLRQKIDRDLAALTSVEEKLNYKFHPSAESYHDIYQRFTHFMDEIAHDNQAGNYLVVTHAGALKTFFIIECAKRGYDLSYSSFGIDNCALLVVEVEGPGQYKITASQNISFK